MKGNICIIPARGGSKGVPRKNVRLLNGIPVIVYSIKAAQDAKIFDAIYVSTEDKEIADVARKAGALVIDRPKELASDKAPMPPVIEHALEHHIKNKKSEPEWIYILQPTSPLRSKEDVLSGHAIAQKESCDSVMGVFEADDPPQWTLTPDENGFLKPLFPIEKYLARRQDLEKAYFDAPLYAIKTSAFRKYKRFLTDKTRYFVVPRERAVDIDTELDFKFAEFLVGR